MKSKIIFFAGSLIFMVLLGTTTNKDNALARVNKKQGVYLFTDCEPVQDYEYLGTVKAGLTFTSGQYEAVRDVLIKKTLKKYPNANGIIFHFYDGGVDKADAIQFEN